MSRVNEFLAFLRQRNVTLDDIDEFAELIEPIIVDGQQGYRLKAISSPDEITQRCQSLLFYTWHCRDYVKKILMDHGPRLSKEAAGNVINECLRNSIPTQVVSYLANAYKHGGVDGSQKWAVDIAPRLGKPYVLGRQLGFPHHLKPTVMIFGDRLADFEFVGQAGVGDEAKAFNDFEWKHSCQIENNDGEVIGDVLTFCEAAFGGWMRILRNAGLVLFPYFMPVNEDDLPWSCGCSEARYLCLFTSERKIQEFQAEAQKSEGVAPTEAQTRYIIFKSANALAEMFETNMALLETLGLHQLVIDPEPKSKLRVAEIKAFARFLKEMDGNCATSGQDKHNPSSSPTSTHT